MKDTTRLIPTNRMMRICKMMNRKRLPPFIRIPTCQSGLDNVFCAQNAAVKDDVCAICPNTPAGSIKTSFVLGSFHLSDHLISPTTTTHQKLLPKSTCPPVNPPLASALPPTSPCFVNSLQQTSSPYVTARMSTRLSSFARISRG